MSQLGSMSPYTIGGGLNFGTVPGQNDYQSAYAQALSLNQQNYGHILAGYQGLGQSQVGAQNQIQQGYGALTNTVMGDIQGIGASQSQALQDQYAQNSGNAAQGLINSGLGNTTVANSVQRGQQLDYQKAQVGLSNQLAQLTAGYQSSLGLAGLNYANQANMQNTALGSQQLGFMNSVNSPYPNASAYADRSLQAQTLALAQRGMNRGMGNMSGGFSVSGGGSKGGFAGLGGALGGAGGATQQGPSGLADVYQSNSQAGSTWSPDNMTDAEWQNVVNQGAASQPAPQQVPSPAESAGEDNSATGYSPNYGGGDTASFAGGGSSCLERHNGSLFAPDMPECPTGGFGGALDFSDTRKRRGRRKKKLGRGRGKRFT